MAPESASDAARELATLYPAPVDVLIAGRLVRIPACTLSQTGSLLSVGMRLFAGLPEDADAISLLDSRPEETAELIALALGVERGWVDGLDVADRGRLVAAWVRVNGAFFVRRLMPAWTELRQAFAAARGGGSMSSPPSNVQAFPSPAGSPPTRSPESSGRSSAPSAVSAASA